MLGNSFPEKFDIRDKEIVAYQLDLLTQLCSKFFPAGPIIFGATVLDRDNRKAGAKFGIVLDQFIGSFL